MFFFFMSFFCFFFCFCCSLLFVCCVFPVEGAIAARAHHCQLLCRCGAEYDPHLPSRIYNTPQANEPLSHHPANELMRGAQREQRQSAVECEEKEEAEYRLDGIFHPQLHADRPPSVNPNYHA